MSEPEPSPAEDASPEPADEGEVEVYDRGERAEEPPAPPGILKILGLLIPPLFLAPLIWIPFDFITMLFWAIAAIATLVSIVSALVRLLQIGFGAASSRRQRLLQLTRPMLTILVFCTARVCTQHSQYVGERDVAILATSIHEAGRKAGEYPEVIEGWSQSTEFGTKTSRTNFGWTAQYAVSYRATKERDGFTLSLRIDKDTEMSVTGSLDQPELKAGVANYMIGPQELSMQELLAR